MPQIAIAAIPAISSLIGGIASGGKQSSQTSTQNSTQKQSVDMLNKAIEPDYFSKFRESLIPQFQDLYKSASDPVYGEAQKGAFINEQNDLYNSAQKSLKSSMAGQGRLLSGGFASALGGMESQRAGAISSFLSQLPFAEKQAKMNYLTPLMQAGMGFAGRAPVSQQTTGTNITTGQAQGTQQNQGPPWWKNTLMGVAGGLNSGWEPWKTPTKDNSWSNWGGYTPGGGWAGG